jgi:hypothetical protein
MAEWAAWLEEVLEAVAMRVGSDIVGNIRLYPFCVMEFRARRHGPQPWSQVDISPDLVG